MRSSSAKREEGTTDHKDAEGAATAGIANAEDGPGTRTTGEVTIGGCDVEDGSGHGADLPEAHQSSKFTKISSRTFGSVTQCLFQGSSGTRRPGDDVIDPVVTDRLASANIMAHTAADETEVVITPETTEDNCSSGTGKEGEKPEKTTKNSSSAPFSSYVCLTTFRHTPRRFCNAFLTIHGIHRTNGQDGKIFLCMQ